MTHRMLKGVASGESVTAEKKSEELVGKTPYRYDNNLNSTLTIGGINMDMYEADTTPTYYSTVDCVGGWNLTTTSIRQGYK